MKKMSMREAYGQALVELGTVHSDVVVLEADVSHSTRTVYFAHAFPERFFNFGIAEANMMSAAAGLAACGKIPFANTFSFLATLRAGDAVRSLIAQNRLNVKIVGSYAGLSDAKDGASHQSVCDLAVMRALPNMTVVVVADAAATRQAVLQSAQCHGPFFLRLSREEVPVSLDRDGHPFEIGKGTVLREGGDVTLFVTGCMVHKGLEAADRLHDEGIAAEVVEIHTLKPLDQAAILRSVQKTRAAVTAEEHSILGGLGSAVAETVVRCGPVPLEFVGLNDTFAESGDYEELLEKYGLGVSHILGAAKKVLQRKG